MSRWFRFYDSVLEDPKVQRMDPVMFKAWVNIMCLASRGEGILPPISDIAFALRISDEQAETVVRVLLTIGLIDDDGEHMKPHNWHNRQFLDRTNSQRQQRFRDKKRDVTKDVEERNAVTPVTHNVIITSQDSDSDTDTDSEKKESTRARKRVDDRFEVFWLAYPKRIGKGAAEKAFTKAAQSTDPNQIIEAVNRHDWPKDPTYIPHPATWLNQRRWQDEPVAKKASLKDRLTQMMDETHEQTDSFESPIDYSPRVSKRISFG